MRITTPILIIVLAITANTSRAQYILNGSAVRNSCNCYTLTPASNTQSGSVWNSNKISLAQPFDFWFNVYLGCKDTDGADGMVFMLQPISTSLGASGGGLGFQGVVPSIGIVLDTWQNAENNDPAFDHISIQANGVISHGTDLAGPVQALPNNPNIEDCQWHILRISWDPATNTLRTYFDNTLRLETQTDLVGTIFNNDPLVYWGFSAATGGSNNLQQFCTALNPDYATNLGAANVSCNLDPISFSSTSQSFGPIQSYYWDFGDGTTSTLPNPPPKTYAQPGIYQTKLVITGLDGCVSDTLRRTVSIGTIPTASFTINDTCLGNPHTLVPTASNQVGSITQYLWLLNGSPVSGIQQPIFTNLPAGANEFGFAVRSEFGCTSDTFRVVATQKPVPVISAFTPDACVNGLAPLQATQIDNATSIAQWNWDAGNGQLFNSIAPAPVYTQTGSYTVKTWATATNGCISDTVRNTINIIAANAFAGNDTIILKDIPHQLQATGGSVYTWTPDLGLSNPTIPNPIVTLSDDQTYVLHISTPEGCTDTDTIHISVFKGSAIYMPTGFTPNSDGLNDIIRPRYIGIRNLEYFTIFNRWGQPVFSTRDMMQGWDGRIKGRLQGVDTYVWMLEAEDVVGKKYTLKGTFTLIR